MFVQRKRNILSKFNRFKSINNNIAFVSTKKYPGFTVGKLYKPFAYSVTQDYYKDFCIFDDNNRVMFMERKFIDNGIFNIVYTNQHNLELVLGDIMETIDKENEYYIELINKNL